MKRRVRVLRVDAGSPCDARAADSWSARVRRRSHSPAAGWPTAARNGRPLRAKGRWPW